MHTNREQLEKLLPQIVDFAKSLDSQDGGPSADDLAQLGKMNADVKGLLAAVKADAEARELIDDAKGYLGASSTTSAAAALAAATGIVDPKGMTLGEAFAKSPAYIDFVKSHTGSNGSIMSVPVVKGATFETGGLYGKALVTGLSDTSAGAFVTTQRLAAVPDLIGQRRLTVRDLCTNITITSDTFDYVTVTGKTNNAAGVLEATTTATPGLNGVAVGAYGASHGLKPESAITFAVVTSIVETIAHMIPITRRAAADGGQILQYVNDFLLYGLREVEENQFLSGTGTTPQVRGILNTSGILTVGSAGTDIDAVVDAIAAVRNANNEPTALVIHPADWFSTGFLMAKDSAGNYLIGDPRLSLDQLNSLWGLRVVVTPAMSQNTALVGDFSKAIVADRQQGTIYVSDSHNDWFQRNLLAILAEERIGFGVLDPEAFCTVTAV